MAKQTVSIIGAGLGGLALGRCLRQRGIAAVLYERTSSAAQHNYVITLYASAYAPLLKTLNVSENAFKRRVAVDAAIGGTGSINHTISGVVRGKADEGEDCFQANRGKLENWLREGLDIRWEHTLQDVEPSPSVEGQPTVRFDNGQKFQTNVIVGADGTHSVLRRSLFPQSELTVLPFVAFNGKRRIGRVVFEDTIQCHLQKSNVISFTRGDIRIKLSIDNYADDKVSASWTYSRPSSGASDPLYKPERTPSGATQIPDELFEELASLLQSGLPKPLDKILDEKEVRKDRLLHWLMRTTLVSKEKLHDLTHGGIVLIGDAVHAEPIVGGNGANAAILDAVSLAEQIAEAQETGKHSLSSWIDKRYDDWQHGIQSAKANIEAMHKPHNAKM
jgi:2-polyprenyl-6-methoxyphenol hydroxylase-like FAD-dependent oxidoreductase